MKKIMLFSMMVLIVGFLLVAGCSKKADQSAPQPLPAVQEPPQLTEPEPAMAKNIVEITSAGFNPKTITVKVGDTVTFVNKDSSKHWPASDLHPVHMTYPGSDIKKCGTTEATTIFDACKGMTQSEEYSFTFDKIGRWPFHDHLKPSFAGVVVVGS